MKAILTTEEEAMLVEAIRAQEQRTSAEIRICVTYKFIWRRQRYAERVFHRTGMDKTRDRNGALIVVMPRMRQIVILGDCGLNAKVPPDYWKEAVAAMVRHMQHAEPLNALREGLRRLGDTLATHWPRQQNDANELPDEIIE